MIRITQENGPGAAATAHRAGFVASGKPTRSDNPNPAGQQSAMAPAEPDKTRREQAAGGQRIVRLSLRSAINAMCKSCIYDPWGGNGTWREQVQACSSANCPLHAVRPMTVTGEKRGGEARQATQATSGCPSNGTPLLADGLDRNGPTAEQRRAA